MTITLNEEQRQAATKVGLLRFWSWEDKNRHRWMETSTPTPDRNGKKANDVDSAGAELAAAILLHRRWLAGVDKPKDPDVEPDIDVKRATGTNTQLMIREHAPPEWRYVLVYGRMPTYDLVGWARGRDVMLPGRLRNPRGNGKVFLVPPAALSTDFTELILREAAV